MIKKATTLFVALACFTICASAFAGNGNEVKVIKSDVSNELVKAAESGMNTILLITDKTDTRFDEALEFAGKTAQFSENTMVAVLDRDLEENSALIEKYRMSRYPAPYLLIMSPSGLITGGASPGKIDAEKFAAYVPSKCYNQLLDASSAGKPVFVYIGHGDVGMTEEWSAAINEATTKMEVVPELISINAQDEAEQILLSKIGYKVSETPVVVVINAKGQPTGSFDKIPAASELIAASAKVAAKGCGGCASSKSCSGKEKAKCGEK
ncbi:MAG: hypothetical protein K9H16_03440 [Bacteroidales bacterium]|nr:hypothetical protein [Bacteroidales bacterium]